MNRIKQRKVDDIVQLSSVLFIFLCDEYTIS